MTTLKDYVSRMADDQKYIYYAAGESRSKIKMMPPDGTSLKIRAMKFFIVLIILTIRIYGDERIRWQRVQEYIRQGFRI